MITLENNEVILRGIKEIRENPSIGTAIADITELLKFKYIKKVGSYRGAYYVLNEERG